MEYISINAAIAFSCFAFFLYYQNIHLKTAAVEKNSLYYLLWVSTILGAITGAGWIYYYARHVIWYAPFMILIAAVVVIVFAAYLEKILPPAIISLIGFVGWPVAAFFMFKFIPLAAQPFLPIE